MLEINRILDYANSRGINTIYTTIAYGDSKAQLDKVGIYGWRVKKTCSQGHVRSAFSQGLLLMEQEERLSKFSRWKTIWDSYEEFLKQ